VDRAAARTDNKWGYDLEWRQLWTRSWDESVPPITFRYGAANGLYVVQLELFVCDDYHGHRASSVRVKVEDDKQFKTVEKDDAPPGKPFFAFVDVGQYMIEDGTFDITLEQGKCSYWAIVRSFRLLPVSDAKDGTNAADQQARMERLRALGYIE